MSVFHQGEDDRYFTGGLPELIICMLALGQSVPKTGLKPELQQYAAVPTMLFCNPGVSVIVGNAQPPPRQPGVSSRGSVIISPQQN